MLQIKEFFHGVLDTKSSLAMCDIQNHIFTVCCEQISLIEMLIEGEKKINGKTEHVHYGQTSLTTPISAKISVNQLWLQLVKQ